MRLITFRQQHCGSQINRLSPELRQQLALYLDVFYVLRIAWRQRRGNLVVKVKPDLIAGKRIQMEMADVAKEISRGLVELLAFPLVHMRPNGVAVRPLEARINIEQRLHIVVPCGKLAYRFQRKTKRQSVKHGCLTRLQ